MKKRVFWSVLLTSIITMLLTAVLIFAVIYNDSEKALSVAVNSEAMFIAKALNTMSDEKIYCSYIKDISENTQNRITIIDSSGVVLFDSYSFSEKMDNHIQRPEIKSAIENGMGEATRNSDTIGEKTHYYALKLTNGNILRVANTTKNVFGLLSTAAEKSIFLFIYIFIVGLLIANLLTKLFTNPLNHLNLDEPLKNKTYEELSPLLLNIEKKNQKIKKQIEKLSSKQKEFDYITSNMSEGLVIFGENGAILSANNSAKSILGGDCSGSYLNLSRNSEYIKAVEKAFSGKSINMKMENGEKSYTLSASSVTKNIKTSGYAVILFIIDNTDKEKSEKIRREFTANVSHELKTPLTSIIGYAEIISNGVAKAKDIPHFSALIYKQGNRLLTLIDDIIRLSRLDEEDFKEEFETVDLLKICQKVISELSNKAEKSEVTLDLKFDEAQLFNIKGLRHVIYEIIYNLCDNGINYNKSRGKVILDLKNENDKIKLTVIDTGIGISPEFIDRVFERFYRIDKSHSKKTGGTGLGLSIVKHGVNLHNADLKIKSEVDKGTEITIDFSI